MTESTLPATILFSEPSTLEARITDGSISRAEPSTLDTEIVDGYVLGNGTFHDNAFQHGRFREQDGGGEGGFCHARPSIPGNDERECQPGKAEDWQTAGNVLN